jgi:hypothetical protein
MVRLGYTEFLSRVWCIFIRAWHSVNSAMAGAACIQSARPLYAIFSRVNAQSFKCPLPGGTQCHKVEASWKAALGGPLPEHGIGCEKLIATMGQHLIPNGSQVYCAGFLFVFKT